MPTLREREYTRALAARDPRFDGVFFVGITTTRIYCRPVCPARVTHHDRRRFFDSAAAAERAGFRPCMRCRPELAPGRSVVDAVSRLARDAAERIAAGELNERSVTALAAELGVSARHLRRALEREIGVSPVELAQTQRLLLAKRLLTDTSLSVTRIAFASGFRSLRRFNAAFRERYRLSPTALRRGREGAPAPLAEGEPLRDDAIRLTLAYRPPLAWDALLATLRESALPHVEHVDDVRYACVARIGEHRGTVLVEHAPPRDADGRNRHLDVWISQSLVPVTMPLLAALRRMLDLDAEPQVIDAHLSQGGGIMGKLVTRLPGMRVPAALDPFGVALRVLVGGSVAPCSPLAQVIELLGDEVRTPHPRLTRCVPSPRRLALTPPSLLEDIGVPAERASALVTLARRLESRALKLERGSDPEATRQALLAIDGVTGAMAAEIGARALGWPDAFCAESPALQIAAGARGRTELARMAERWRPWRAYAGLHLTRAVRP